MSFRPMRRHRQALTLATCEEILHQNTSGVLALHGDDGYPYAVPLSYVYDEKKLYFHVAKTGHKIDALKANPNASFCVIDQDLVVPEEYTTYFRSVITFGKVYLIENESEKQHALKKLGRKYAPQDSDVKLDQEINKSWNNVAILVFDPEHISGKEAIELIQKPE